MPCAHPQAMERSLAIPTMRPFLPSSSGAFATGMVMPISAILAGGGRQQRQRMPGNHQFFIGRQHAEHHATTFRRNDSLPRCIRRGFQPGAEPGELFGDTRAHRRRPLADPCGKDEGVETAE